MNNKAIEAAIAGWFESNDGAYTKDPEFHVRMQKAISAYHAALVEDEAMEAGHRPACYARETILSAQVWLAANQDKVNAIIERTTR